MKFTTTIEYPKGVETDTFYYTGHLLDGKPNDTAGLQKIVSRNTRNGKMDTATYRGNIANGHREGYGVYMFPGDTVKYLGQFKEDKFNGMGKLYHDSGNIRLPLCYEGEFENGDAKEAQGTFYYTNGIKVKQKN